MIVIKYPYISQSLLKGVFENSVFYHVLIEN